MWLKLNEDGTPVGRGRDEALLLPHRPVLRAPADHPQGGRVRAGDGARHDPGRPRGRARPDRAELRLRPRRADRRQPLDLPSDLQSRSGASSAPSRASCRSRSWASRRTAATTTSRSGRATRTRSCPTPTTVQKPSQIGLYAIGGILEHLGALTAVTASTVNSYRRLWDTGFWAPVFADWGYQNRTTALRVSAPGRFEYRSVDSAVNPYLSMAGLIAACETGSSASSTRASPRSGTSTRRWRPARRSSAIPMTFGDALDALEADEVVKKALPGEMYRVFMHYKRDEWERYCATVTRLGRDGVPGRSAVAEDLKDDMCGIAGIIYRDGAEHADRRRDDADAPVDEAPRARLDRLRAVRRRPRTATSSCATSSRTRTRRVTSSSRIACAGTASRSRRGSPRSAPGSTRSTRRRRTRSGSRSTTTAT